MGSREGKETLNEGEEPESLKTFFMVVDGDMSVWILGWDFSSQMSASAIFSTFPPSGT